MKTSSTYEIIANVWSKQNFQQGRKNSWFYSYPVKNLLSTYCRFPKINCVKRRDRSSNGGGIKQSKFFCAFFLLASKNPVHLQDKVNRLSDIREQHKIFSPVSDEKRPKGNRFVNPVFFLAKG